MEKYKQVEYLGYESIGEVWLVENKKTTELFAMKCFKRGHQIDKYLAREIIIQKSLYHPNVIQFKEVVLSSTYLCIVMEYAEGGDLYNKIFIKGLNENTARYYFQQLISGVFYCHTKGMCHRDLKPENILLDGSDLPCLKICDIGFSKQYRMHSKLKSAIGTPQYSAPEVCSREYDGKLADLWSCGVILYTMLVGEHPKYRPNDTGEASNVYETNACPFSLPDSLSPDSKDLLARMLVVDPRKRIAIEEIMKHRWFKKKLKGKLAEAFQVTKENPRFALQSDEEIVIIVEEAIIPPPEDANVTEEYFEFEEEEEDEDSSCGSCMGVADAIVDLVSSGTTLNENDLKEIKGGIVLKSQAVIVASRKALIQREGVLDITRKILKRLEKRLETVGQFRVSANTRGSSVEEAAKRILSQPSLSGLQVVGSGVLVSLLTNIFNEETPRWYELLRKLGL